jgi:hypothetical protein
MTKIIILVCLFFLFSALSFSISAQDNVDCRVGAKTRTINLLTDSAANSNETARIVKDILFYAGKSPTLVKTQAAEVKSAVACLAIDGTPYRILYSPSFFLQLYEDTSETWATTAILAHEVGHIINNHFVDSDHASTPELELAADKFAGKILAKMGADLEPTLSAFKSKYMQSADGDSYPSTEKRIQAVKEGWEAEISDPTPPNVLIQKNAKKLKNKVEELGNKGFKFKPISFDLLGMKCHLEEVVISKNEANNLYECNIRDMSDESYEKFRKTLNETVEQAFKGEELKYSVGSYEDKFELLNNSSKLKSFSFYSDLHEPISLDFRFLFSWKETITLPYLPFNPSQTINIGEEIAANISFLESTDISNIKKSFNLIGMDCSSDYDGTKTKVDGSDTPIKINFSCSSSFITTDVNERRQKIREISSSIEYALRGKSYTWKFFQGNDYSVGEGVSFTIPQVPTKNRLDYISVSENLNYVSPPYGSTRRFGGISLKFIILK